MGAEVAAQVEAHIDICEDCRVLLSSVVRAQRDAHGLATTHQVAASPVTEGDIIAGKYKIDRVIGAGGMGTVVAASHLQLNQPVALKFMLPAIAADPQAAARFLREARAAVRLSSPHVGRVLDLDSLPNGTPYLVMELLEGITLAQALQEQKRMSATVALGWVRQALSALSEAHALGIVHRDFKPANLFLARKVDGSTQLKVLDFGIAKSIHPDIEKGLSGTSSQMLLGSPPYMAPEQVNPGATVDARTDVWACGVVLYELLSGVLPFEGKTFVDVMYSIANKAPKPLPVDVPAAIAAVIDRCLAKQAATRYADASALLTALNEAERAPVAAVVAPVLSRPPPFFTLGKLVAIGVSVGVAAAATWVLARPAPKRAESVIVAPPPVARAPVAPTAVAEPPEADEPAPAKPAAKKRPPSDSAKNRAFEERR